jgi:hypothetical protein
MEPVDHGFSNFTTLHPFYVRLSGLRASLHVVPKRKFSVPAGNLIQII